MKDQSNLFAQYVTIDDAVCGQRLDNFLLKTLKGAPPSHIYRIIRSGEIRVNGKRAKPDSRLAISDKIRLPPIRLPEKVQEKIEGAPSPAMPSAMKNSALKNAAPLKILYEDEFFLALNKPSGTAVHGGSGVSFGVIEELRAKRPDARFLELAHRIDRETSGVLLIAKKRAALVALHALWRAGDIEKRYTLLVQGSWRDEKRKVALPLLRTLSANGERRVFVSDEGQPAETVFYRERVWRCPEFSASLLEARLLTGRTHQIRVHAAHLSHPLAGDDKYGDFSWNKRLAELGLKRMFLHAQKLSFTHPMTSAPITIEAPLPETLAAFLRYLDQTRI